MAKFKFQLDAVERIRNQAEQKTLEELARTQANYQAKIAEKNEILNKKQKAFVQKNELASRDSNVNEIKLQEDFITGLKQQVIKADQAIIRARRFLEQAMRAYIKARKERMMVEKLKENAEQVFKLEQSRLEQKQLDDLITMRARLNHGPLSDEHLSEEEMIENGLGEKSA